jgi:hypothetical protein
MTEIVFKWTNHEPPRRYRPPAPMTGGSATGTTRPDSSVSGTVRPGYVPAHRSVPLPRPQRRVVAPDGRAVAPSGRALPSTTGTSLRSVGLSGGAGDNHLWPTLRQCNNDEVEGAGGTEVEEEAEGSNLRLRSTDSRSHLLLLHFVHNDPAQLCKEVDGVSEFRFFDHLSYLKY